MKCSLLRDFGHGAATQSQPFWPYCYFRRNPSVLYSYVGKVGIWTGAWGLAALSGALP